MGFKLLLMDIYKKKVFTFCKLSENVPFLSVCIINSQKVQISMGLGSEKNSKFYVDSKFVQNGLR